LPGSKLLFTLVIPINSGALTALKTDHALLPDMTQPELLTMLFYCKGHLAGAAVGVLQIVSAGGRRRLLEEDKEYPCLIE